MSSLLVRVEELEAGASGQRGLVLTGSGSPEGAVTATVGTLYLRTDGGAGSTLYVKELTDVGGDASKGWAAK